MGASWAADTSMQVHSCRTCCGCSDAVQLTVESTDKMLHHVRRQWTPGTCEQQEAEAPAAAALLLLPPPGAAAAGRCCLQPAVPTAPAARRHAPPADQTRQRS